MHKILQGLAIATLVLAVIAGIVAGNVFAPEPQYSFQDKDFLWNIAITWWVSGVVSAIILFAFAEVIELLHKMVNNQQRLIESISERDKTDNTHSHSDNPTAKVDLRGDTSKFNLDTPKSSLSSLQGYKMNSHE